MLVNFDDRLSMRDLYYPRVGQSNHILGHRNSIGVWVDGAFDWVHGPKWKRTIRYEPDTLVSHVTATHQEIAVKLEARDAVHYREDIFLRKMIVHNLMPSEREVRVFFNHDFCIDESDIGDTSLYDMSTDAILHYKRDKCLLMSGRTGEHGVFQYANGTKRFGGVEGTWRDAEDGWLEGNPIAQGSVDSTISFRINLGPLGDAVLYYWIAAGSGFDDVRRLHRLVCKEGVEELLKQTRVYWRSWLGKAERDFLDLSARAVDLFRRSLLIVRTQIDRGGAITAANDSDILHFNRDHYSYMWPRDGALVAYALDAAGYTELTREFFKFCARGISRGGYLWHKYHPDGSVGSSWHPWLSSDGPQLPIQEDETALVLWSLWHFFQMDRDLEFVESLYDCFIKPAAEFMCNYRDKATGLPLESYDLWEERRGVYTFTASAVWAGLRAAARFARIFGEESHARKFRKSAGEVREGILEHLYMPELGRFARGIYRVKGEICYDTTLESSLYGVHAFRVLPPDDPRVVSTMKQIESGLAVRTSVGGYARYEGDEYFGSGVDVPGNPWIIASLWIAEYHISKARREHDFGRAREIIEWVADRALSSGVLPEQLHPTSGKPLSVAPLTWSHSTYVLTVLKYLEARNDIENRARLAQAWHVASE